jgi:hypothetical protein
MDSITIGFSRPSGWFEPFSWLIRLMDWSSFSHAYVKYYDNYTSRWVIFQSSGLQVNYVGEILFNSKEIVCGEFDIPITKVQKLQVIQYALDTLGTPYGLKHILGIVIVKLANVFGKRIRNPFPEPGTDVCSELVAYTLDKFILPGSKLNFETATPTDVYNFLSLKYPKAVI